MAKVTLLPPNPFTQSLKIPVYYKNSQIGYASGGAISEVRPLDQDRRVTLFTQHLIEVLPKLSSPTLRVLFHIFVHLRTNQDYTEVRVNKLTEEMGYKSTIIYKALKELVSSGLLADRRSVRLHTYWLNPYYFFPGNRVQKYPDNLLDIKNEVEEDEDETSEDYFNRMNPKEDTTG